MQGLLTGVTYERLKKPPSFSNDEAWFATFKAWMDDNTPNKNDRMDPTTIAALVNKGRFSYPYIPAGSMQRSGTYQTSVCRHRKRLHGLKPDCPVIQHLFPGIQKCL